MAAKRFAYSQQWAGIDQKLEWSGIQQWAGIDQKLEWSGGRNRLGDRNRLAMGR